MTQETQQPKETEQQQYERLMDVISAFIAESYDEDEELHPFTSEQKREFGEVLANNMTPSQFSTHVNSVGDIYYGIAEDYQSLTDIELARAFVAGYNYETVDEWITDHGLPLPDSDDMIEQLMRDIDEEDYINENYEEVLDMLPEQCEFNLSDAEIVDLFEDFVEEPDYDLRDGAVVICDASERLGCVAHDCIHAVAHIYDASCIEPVCAKAGVRVSCVPVLVK